MKEYKITESQVQIIGAVLMKLTVETALQAIDALRSLPLLETEKSENIETKENL